MSCKKENTFYVCSCYYTNNIFLSQLSLHVTYFDDDTFWKDWKQILISKGCDTDDAFEHVLQQVKKEVQRRKTLGYKYLERRKTISECYIPLHLSVYKLQTSFLKQEFLELVEHCNQDGASVDSLLDRIQVEKGEQVYSFPMFTEEFCRMFAEEIEHFENTDLPKGRPNTMNNYGVLMNELGFDDNFITPLRLHYVKPITRLLYPAWGGDSLDSHKAFVVKYKIGEDLSLNYHYDNAEVTINVALQSDYTDGSLYFGGIRFLPLKETQCTEYSHKATYGLIHRGQHMHGALPISHGERYNLIIWMRSSSVRNQLCPMCDQTPRLIKTVGFGDGFTNAQQSTVDVCCTV